MNTQFIQSINPERERKSAHVNKKITADKLFTRRRALRPTEKRSKRHKRNSHGVLAEFRKKTPHTQLTQTGRLSIGRETNRQHGDRKRALFRQSDRESLLGHD